MASPAVALVRCPAPPDVGMDVTPMADTVAADTTTRTAPGVPGSYLLGSALDLRRAMLGACERAFEQYGDVVRSQVGPPGLRLELYLLYHPDHAHRLLFGASANYRKENVFYSEVRNAFGDGLVTSQDAEWQRQRRFLSPLFPSPQGGGDSAPESDQGLQTLQGRRRAPAAPVRTPREDVPPAPRTRVLV